MENPAVTFCNMARISLPNTPKVLIFESCRDEDIVHICLMPGREWVSLQPYFLSRPKAGVAMGLFRLTNHGMAVRVRGQDLPPITPENPMSLCDLASEMHKLDYPFGVVKLLHTAGGISDEFRFVSVRDLRPA